MSPLGLLLLIILVLLFGGALPVWSHAQAWGGGYQAPGVLFIVLVVVLVLALSGRL